MADIPEDLAILPGGRELAERYGKAPSFHDAEVISLNLSRSGVSTLTLQPFPPDDPSLVHFDLESIADLELADFSCQNVISSLVVQKSVRNGVEVRFRVSLGPCYGLQGWIEAEKVVIRLG